MRFSTLLRCLTVLAVLFVAADRASAQAPIPVPANPVAFCGTQAAPTAASYQIVFDGQAAEPVTMVTPTTADSATATPIKTFCNANTPGWTHGFTVAANRFTVGTHNVRVLAVNQFGSTQGPLFPVLVGVAPGQFTIGGTGQLP